jgi:cytochrome c peroxidase
MGITFLSFNRIKMKTLTIKSIFIFIFFVLIISCKKDDEPAAVYTPTPYSLKVPNGFPPPEIDASKLTVEEIRLGRMLYYDPILSSNGLTCSSCHEQSVAFSHSIFVHPNGDRTSVPAHINLAWKRKFLWEGALNSIENVCIGDFEPEFFNTNMDDLVQKLTSHSTYPELFYQAFNISDISKLSHQELKEKIVEAIAQYVNTLTSSNSIYDKYLRHELALTSDELRGYIIFNTEEGDCFHCHGSVLFTDNKQHNNGLVEIPIGQDMGLFNFSHDSLDVGKFLAPTLRNIELTAPYMHDGRYQTLEEVVEFYNSGVHQNSPNIDPIMTKPAKLYGLHLSAYDKQCLVQFMKTLTDTFFISNPEYSSPF